MNMQIQISTGSNIQGNESLSEHIQSVIEFKLNRFSERITRLEIHLSDENGDKNGNEDKRCVIEARVKGKKPVAVTHQAETLDLALSEAADKMLRLLDSAFKHQHK